MAVGSFGSFLHLHDDVPWNAFFDTCSPRQAKMSVTSRCGSLCCATWTTFGEPWGLVSTVQWFGMQAVTCSRVTVSRCGLSRRMFVLLPLLMPVCCACNAARRW